MSDLIRMLGMAMSRQGTCNKCGESRNKGSHSKCDRWPSRYGCGKGFHYISNAKQSTLEDLRDIVAAICAGEDLRTPVRFDLRIMQTANAPDDDEPSTAVSVNWKDRAEKAEAELAAKDERPSYTAERAATAKQLLIEQRRVHELEAELAALRDGMTVGWRVRQADDYSKTFQVLSAARKFYESTPEGVKPAALSEVTTIERILETTGEA